MRKAVLLVVLWLASAAAAGELDVPLSVRDNARVKRAGWPVTSGVPFRPGTVKDVAALRVLDAAGKEVPAQFDPFVKWWSRDGSAKWLLVDFLADVPAGGESKYWLVMKPGPGARAARAASPLRVTETDSAVEVVTGPMKVIISKERGTLIESAWLDLDGDGRFADRERVIRPDPYNGSVVTSAEQEIATGALGDFNMWGSGGRMNLKATGEKLIRHRYTSGLGRPASVTVETRGPVRATVRIEGVHHAGKEGDGIRKEGFYEYSVWLSFYAGSSLVKVLHSVDNHRPGFPMHSYRIHDLRVGFALDDWAAEGAKYLFGGEKGDAAGELAAGEGSGASLEQSPESYRVLAGGNEAAAGGIAPGWADLSGSGRGVTVELDNFWEEAPKGLRLAPGRIEAALLPGFFDDVYNVHPTTRKSHTLNLYLHKGDAAAAKAADHGRAMRRPLMAWAGSKYYADCHVWPRGLGVGPETPPPDYSQWRPRTPRTGPGRSRNWPYGVRPRGHWRTHGAYTYFNPGGMHDNYWSVFYRFLQSGDLSSFEHATARAKWASESLSLLVKGYSTGPDDANTAHEMIGWGPKKLSSFAKSMTVKGNFYVSARPPYAGVLANRRMSQQVNMNGEHLIHMWPYEWYYLTGSPIARDMVMGVGNIAKYSIHRNWFARHTRSYKAEDSPKLDNITEWHLRKPGYFYTRIYTSHLFSCAMTYAATGDPNSLYYLHWLARRMLQLHRENGGPLGEPGRWNSIPTWQESEAVIAAFEHWRETGDEEMLDLIGSWLEFVRAEAFVPGQGMPHRFKRGEKSRIELHWYPAVAAPECWTALGDPKALEITRVYAAGGRNFIAKNSLTKLAHGQAALYALTHLPADLEPPAAVTDLKVLRAAPDGVTLAWTAPKDSGEGSTGSAASYWIKYADKPIVLHPKFPDEIGKKYGFYHCDNVRGEPAPKRAGARERFTVTEIAPHNAYGSPEKLTVEDLKPGTYRFVLRSRDAAGNISPISNVAEVEVK